MKASKVTFQDSNRSRTLDDAQSLANTHFSFIQTSSFVELRDGNLKRRRQKFNYKDIYLEKHDYKQSSVRTNSTKIFNHSIEPNCSSLRSSVAKQSNRKKANEQKISNQGDLPYAASGEEEEKQKTNNSNVVKSERKDLLSIKTKQEREYKRRKEMERNEEEYFNSNQFHKQIKGSNRDARHSKETEYKKDSNSNIDYNKLGSSTKKISTKYQEKLQYINFNDFLSKNEVQSNTNRVHEENKSEINQRNFQNDRYDYYHNTDKAKEYSSNNKDLNYECNEDNRNSKFIKQNYDKRFIRNINVIPQSINNAYFHQINNCSKGSNCIDKEEVCSDEVNLKSSKHSLTSNQIAKPKQINEESSQKDFTQRNCTNRRLKYHKEIKPIPQRDRMVNKEQSLKKKETKGNDQSNFNRKWQRAIETNTIVRNNSKDFFSYVYKAKDQICSALDNNNANYLSSNQSNIVQDQLKDIKTVGANQIEHKDNDEVINEEMFDQNKQRKGLNQHGILRNSPPNQKRSQSRDEIDDIKLINMMKTSNAANSEYFQLNSEKENAHNPSSKIINYSQFLNKKPANKNKAYRLASELNMQQFKDNSMDLNDKEPEANDFNNPFKTNIKMGNRNISTIQKDKEANDDSYAHERIYNKKRIDSLGDLLIKDRGDIYNEQYDTTPRYGDCHSSDFKRMKYNSHIKTKNSFCKSKLKSIDKDNVNNNHHHNRDNVLPLNQNFITTRLSSNKRIRNNKAANIVQYNANAIYSDNKDKATQRHQLKSMSSNSPCNCEDKDQLIIASRKNFHLFKQKNRGDKAKIYQQIEERIQNELFKDKDLKNDCKDCNSQRMHKSPTDEIFLSRGYQTFPINPYYNDHFSMSSSTILQQNKKNSNGVTKVSSLARSLSQGSLLSITDQYILKHQILLSPNSTIRNDLLRNTLSRQNSTFYIDKLKQDLQDYALSREKSLKNEIKSQNDSTQVLKHKIINRIIMPPNGINEIEYYFV